MSHYGKNFNKIERFSGNSGKVTADKLEEGRKKRKLEMLQELKDILENIEDLDPEFSKVIDDNFWDLVR
jgi:hypothetical protein